MFDYCEETVELWKTNFLAKTPTMEMYREEIDEVMGTIENERIFRKGCCGSEGYCDHTKNIAGLEAYLEWLQESTLEKIS